jgi:hypothetical protein
VDSGRAALQSKRGNFSQLCRTPRSQQQARSFSSKGKRGGGANSGAGSGNEDDLSVQGHGYYFRAWKERLVLRGV